AARVPAERRWLEAAERPARFLHDHLQRDGRLLRTFRAGRAHIDAFLEDYAYLADALIDLYEGGGHPRPRLSFHLDRADLRERAMEALTAWGKAVSRAPRAFPASLLVVELLLEGPVELAFAGAPDDEGRRALERAVARRFLANRHIAHADPAA